MIDKVEQFGKEPKDLLKEFLNLEKVIPFKLRTGKVVNNQDPLKIGRCKIRVYGVFGDEIPDSDLPWAVMDASFVGGDAGSFIVPPVDAIVHVYFDGDQIYSPKYTTKVLDRSNLSSEKDEDYPDTMLLFQTNDNEYFKINRKTKESTYRHSSGTMFKIDDAGNVNVFTEGKITVPNGTVLVDPLGGPFCALPNCLFTGSFHQGKQLTSTPL